MQIACRVDRKVQERGLDAFDLPALKIVSRVSAVRGVAVDAGQKACQFRPVECSYRMS